MTGWCKGVKPLLVGSLVTALALGGVPAWAQQVLEDLDEGVEVELQTNLPRGMTAVGQPFEAELQEPLQYQAWQIPAGTEFRGEVMKVKPSRPFNRPGYLVLRVQEAVFPTGQTFSLEGYKPRIKKLRDPNANTFVGSWLSQVPYTLAGLGATIPLRYAAEVDNFTTVPIGLGVRMVAGAIGSLFIDRYEGQPMPRRLVAGALQGSGIPRTVQFISGRDPEPDLAAGEEIELFFNPDALRDMFQAQTTVNAPGRLLQPQAQAEDVVAMPLVLLNIEAEKMTETAEDVADPAQEAAGSPAAEPVAQEATAVPAEEP